MADITSENNLNTRRHRTYPRVVKRARHNSYRVKKPGDYGIRRRRPLKTPLTTVPAPPGRTCLRETAYCLMRSGIETVSLWHTMMALC